MELTFSGEVFHWRGPSPFHFVRVPDDECDLIADVASMVTYGWGMIPVEVTLGKTGWRTSLFPKDAKYLIPVKAAIRKAERVSLGDTVTVTLTLTIEI